MADEPKIIHIARAKQDDNIPKDGPDACPKCKGELEAGFGLAGGGYGVYMYCPRCGDIVSKTQVE